MSKSPIRMQLGFSPLSKTIKLAKMRDVDGGRLRVGNEPPRDVTNEAAQMVWQLVMAEGGEIAWNMSDGSKMVLTANKEEPKSQCEINCDDGGVASIAKAQGGAA